jgi:manganese oxidase
MRLVPALLVGVLLATTSPSAPSPHAPSPSAPDHAARRAATGGPASATRSAPETIAPNDNRRPGGRLAAGTLAIDLEARRGTWYPEGPRGRGLEVAAWAEVGKPLQNPGPLIRVATGTIVQATLRNALDRPLVVFGFGAGGRSDSVVVAAGETARVSFTAQTPGTYYYAGKTSRGPIESRAGGDSQLNGAIVVEPPNASLGAVDAANDRVFVMSWFFTLDSTSATGLGHGTMAINGLSWPHTERIDLVQGDSVRWRVVNLSGSDHPMHLHGFYFRVDAKGDGRVDTTYAPASRRLAVTELMIPAYTMTLAWAPTRPGNWIFHCHYSSHVSHLVSLDSDRGTFNEHGAASHAADAPHQMFGLVLGIRVAPRSTTVAAAPAARVERPIRILVRERANVYGANPGFSFVEGGSADDASGALPIPARPLVLTKDEPVAVTIVNRSTHPATIHWHGIELESYPDGVPGWSGEGARILPHISAGDSMTVHFTPPRAGTFMYHSHFDEMNQINSGLYGPIIVVDRGERFDPETDHVFMVGNGGPTRNVIRGPFPLLLNGQAAPAPIELKAGVSHRFRFINISDDFPTMIGMFDGERPITWRFVAKDGATLPPNQAITRPARLVFDPGEIYDFTYTPPAAGELRLRFGHFDVPGIPPFPKTDVAIRVR